MENFMGKSWHFHLVLNLFQKSHCYLTLYHVSLLSQTFPPTSTLTPSHWLHSFNSLISRFCIKYVASRYYPVTGPSWWLTMLSANWYWFLLFLSFSELGGFLMARSQLFWIAWSSITSLTEMAKCSDISWTSCERQNSSYLMISRWTLYAL